MPEGVERQGIGTPATRAAIIEKLVQKGFLAVSYTHLAVENQWNSQLARRIVLAFPVEVPKEQYLSMIKELSLIHI